MKLPREGMPFHSLNLICMYYHTKNDVTHVKKVLIDKDMRKNKIPSLKTFIEDQNLWDTLNLVKESDATIYPFKVQ